VASSDQEAITNELIEAPIPKENLPKWLRPHGFAYEFISDGSTHYTILRDKIHRMAKRLQIEMTNERTGEPRFGEVLTEVYFRNDRYALGLLIEHPIVTRTYFRKGPPVHLESAAAEFRSVHPEAIVADGYLCSEERREWTHANDMIEDFLGKNPIEGLLQVAEQSVLTKQVLNVLYRYVLPIEPQSHERMTRVKPRQ
jgi:tRNA nucleotidyltransferase (CCA-adding enzyme)